MSLLGVTIFDLSFGCFRRALPSCLGHWAPREFDDRSPSTRQRRKLQGIESLDHAAASRWCGSRTQFQKTNVEWRHVVVGFPGGARHYAKRGWIIQRNPEDMVDVCRWLPWSQENHESKWQAVKIPKVLGWWLKFQFRMAFPIGQENGLLSRNPWKSSISFAYSTILVPAKPVIIWEHVSNKKAHGWILHGVEHVVNQRRFFEATVSQDQRHWLTNIHQIHELIKLQPWKIENNKMWKSTEVLQESMGLYGYTYIYLYVFNMCIYIYLCIIWSIYGVMLGLYYCMGHGFDIDGHKNRWGMVLVILLYVE